MMITPEIIPHEEFHRGIWYIPVERPGWYYFSAQQTVNNIIYPFFINTVDAPLRELVSFLHKKNIKTTPSCSGHFMSRESIEKIYYSLQKDQKEIRVGGLKLTQVETGKSILFKDQNYVLPFTKNKFILKVNEMQSRGVLGIRCKSLFDVTRRLSGLSIENVAIKKQDEIILILTRAYNAYDNDITWQKITYEIKNRLNE